MTWVTALLEALFGAFFKNWFGAREQAAARTDSNAAHERAGAAEAANETEIAISEVAAARADLPPPPDDAMELVKALRERARKDSA